MNELIDQLSDADRISLLKMFKTNPTGIQLPYTQVPSLYQQLTEAGYFERENIIIGAVNLIPSQKFWDAASRWNVEGMKQRLAAEDAELARVRPVGGCSFGC